MHAASWHVPGLAKQVESGQFTDVSLTGFTMVLQPRCKSSVLACQAVSSLIFINMHALSVLTAHTCNNAWHDVTLQQPTVTYA